MKSLIKPLRDIGFLTIALTLALVANFAYGQWTNPTTAPVDGNVAIPIHEGGGTQTKVGQIGAVQLLASDRMRSDLYCDYDGNNCFRPCEVSGSCVAVVQGTWQTGSWGSCSGACGTSGTQSRSVSCPSSAGCAGARPASTQSCQNAACVTPLGTWSVGAWSSCQGACGTTGVQYRTVTCSSSAGCSGTQPTSTQSCQNAACVVTYSDCAGSSTSYGAVIPASSHLQVRSASDSNGSGTYQCNDGSWLTITENIQRR